MKRIVLLLMAALFILPGLTGCQEPMVYNLSELIPELMDIETQYPYVEKIIVTDTETGEQMEFTEGVDHDRIRMQFQDLQCIREKESGSVPGYLVSFVTTDGTTDVLVVSREGSYLTNAVVIGGYRYECLISGVDQTFFAGLFGNAE